jgi:hypothetical protein
MADQKISAMPSATVPLTGAELIPMVQGGANVKSTLAALGQYAVNTLANYGAFQDLGAAQTAAANTVVQLRIDTVDFTQGVTKVGNRVSMTNAGVYSIIISLQLLNDKANYDDFTLWPVINGTAAAGSASVIGVSEKKGGINGHSVLCVQYTFQFAAGGYIEFYWHNVAGNASVITFPASTVTPVHPAAAGVILSVIQVG